MRKFIQRHIQALIRYYPPLLGAGIRVGRISPDCREIDVEMKLRFWNANYMGTQYGGSLFSMTDPFFALMLIQNLGREYLVWDKAASIRFRKPGRGRVTAKFRLTEDEIESVRRALTTQEKVEPVYRIDICDDAGEVVAEVEHTLYVRRK